MTTRIYPEKFEKVVFLLEFVPKVFAKYQSIFKSTKKKNFSMIDIGTGPGKMLFEIQRLLPKHYKEIVATDRAKEMIEYFDSVPKDSRITSRVLDITDEKIPHDLRERFDFAFSSFCFAYVWDLRRVFRNCRDLLKPQGEAFMIWPLQSHIYEIYRNLSKQDKWAPYTSDFKNWKSLIEQEDPISIIRNVVEAAGLETVKIDEYRDFAFEDTKDVMLELYASLDQIRHRIPEIDKQKYIEDFMGIVRSEQVVSEENDIFKIPLATVVVIIRKN